MLLLACLSLVVPCTVVEGYCALLTKQNFSFLYVLDS